ncbi:rod shape-determining protein MreD [Aliikangiella marina]|uniref:Rod shape-determining protein MreD n=1 Tax=Aliikangiella marina TaxID=1712262 RepID=A0A545TDT3_9GAMM|nr:rod shape-determining protein MreD [Aliikangiella marina]TQV75382.1 rod shape-determining protein MreD [Aliikangiella marina]
MKGQAESKGTVAIVVSLFVAMLMNTIPFPDLVTLFKPDWVAMVLVYWVMALPNRVGVFSGFLLGLFVDVLEGSLLGINALSLAVVAFLIQMLYHRLRLFPRWKQAINVAVIVGIHRLLVVILSGLVEPVSTGISYWFPLVAVAIFWPWVFIILRDVRRRFC